METETLETQEIVSPAIIYQQDKAAIDVQIATAKAYPRSIKRAMENALTIVTMDKETAETCNYSLPRGDKPISGPSVHLAKILAQQWGNLRIDAKVVNIDATHVTSESVCFDLETNLAIKTQVKRSIMQNVWETVNGKRVKTGKMIRMNDDMITVTGNAANSIALRNAVLSVIPRSVVNKVYNAAKEKITGDISDKTKLIARRNQVVNALKDAYSVTEAEILAAINKASIDHIDGDDILILIGIGQSIKDGDTTVELAFKKPPLTKEDKIKAAQEKKEELKKKKEKEKNGEDKREEGNTNPITPGGQGKFEMP